MYPALSILLPNSVEEARSRLMGAEMAMSPIVESMTSPALPTTPPATNWRAPVMSMTPPDSAMPFEPTLPERLVLNPDTVSTPPAVASTPSWDTVPLTVTMMLDTVAFPC
jgi:hypothetical protein